MEKMKLAQEIRDYQLLRYGSIRYQGGVRMMGEI
jgi:hypothetical protein